MIKQTKNKRSEEKTEKLKREFLLGINEYHVGSIKEKIFQKLNNHIIQGDGDYLIIDNRIGKFSIKMRDAERPGLPCEIKQNRIDLKVPKIPEEMYHKMIEFFRHIASTMSNAEAFIQFYYDLEDQKYVAYVPQQKVSGASVVYDAGKNLDQINRSRYIFVFECHSHNNMNAFWSATDNRDEKDTRFFGVIGKINNPTVEERYRTMAAGKELALTKESIFNFSEKEAVDFPKEWTKNVSKMTFKQFPKTRSSSSERNKFWNDYYDEEDKIAHQYKKKEEEEEVLQYYKDVATFPDEVEDWIYDTFDLEKYGPEEKMIIFEAFGRGLKDEDIPLLHTALVDYGFDGMLHDLSRYSA